MKCKKSDVLAMLSEMGFEAAGEWPDDKLAAKLEKIGKLLKGKKPKSKPLLSLATKLAAAGEDGTEVEVIDDVKKKGGKAGPKTEPVKNTKPGAKKKAAPVDDDEEEEEEDEDDTEEEDEDDEEEDVEADEEEDEDGDDDEEGDDDSSDEDDEDDEDVESDEDEDSEEEDEDSDDEDEDAESDDEDEDDSEEDEDEDSDDDDDEDDSQLEDEDEEVETTTKKVTKKVATKPGKNGKAGPKSEPVKNVKPKASEKKGPGVIDTIIDLLTNVATPEKPLSKKKITELVEKKCGGERAGTVEQQVPGKLKRERGLNIMKNEKGYWIGGKKKKAK